MVCVVLHTPSLTCLVNPRRCASSTYVVYNNHANIGTGHIDFNSDLHSINAIRWIFTPLMRYDGLRVKAVI